MMVFSMKFIGLGALVLLILYATLNPAGGVIDGGPGAWLGLGMIGLGLCLESRQRLITTARQQDLKPVTIRLRD